MKKFLSMFAFAAAIVLGAFALASCGDDDEDGPNATHNFTLDGVFESNLASVRESEAFKKANADIASELRIQFKDKDLVSSMTDTQATLLWSQFRDKQETRQIVQDLLDKKAAEFKDRTLTLTLIYKRDGKKWQGAMWTTTYKDEWYK